MKNEIEVSSRSNPLRDAFRFLRDNYPNPVKSKTGDCCEFDIRGSECAALAEYAGPIINALKSAQWVSFNDSDWGETTFCPLCRMKPEHGHHETCEIRLALAGHD